MNVNTIMDKETKKRMMETAKAFGMSYSTFVRVAVIEKMNRMAQENAYQGRIPMPTTTTANKPEVANDK